MGKEDSGKHTRREAEPVETQLKTPPKCSLQSMGVNPLKYCSLASTQKNLTTQTGLRLLNNYYLCLFVWLNLCVLFACILATSTLYYISVGISQDGFAASTGSRICAKPNLP